MKRALLLCLLPFFSTADTLVVYSPSGDFIKAIPLENGFKYQVTSDATAAQLEHQHGLAQLENSLSTKMRAPSSNTLPIESNNIPKKNKYSEGDKIKFAAVISSYQDEYRRLIERQVRTPLRSHCVVSMSLSAIGHVNQLTLTEGDTRDCQGLVQAIERVPHFPLPSERGAVAHLLETSMAFSPKHHW